MSDGMGDAAARMGRWQAWLDLGQETALDPEAAIVDPHHHLWDRGDHTYLPAQFAAEAQASGHRVLASIYVECLSHYLDSGPQALRPVGETAYVAALARAAWQVRESRGQAGAPEIAAGLIAFADLALGEGVDEVLDAHVQHADGRLRGIRYSTAHDSDPAIHSAYPTRAGMLREAAVQAGASRLARRGLSLDVWVYFHQLGDVLALASACPDLSIVIDHAGGPIGLGPYSGQRSQVLEQWRVQLQALSRAPNVSLKFGGLAMPLAGFEWRKRPRPPDSQTLAEAWRPYWEICLDAFGPQRCMFESNFPVDRSGCTYGALWNAFQRLAASLSVHERHQALAATAQRVYRL
ncbi:MAG: amidohydrolase family protein [Comamonadaceae bacterium]|nr:amidohydrolase family protein [Comamonadaceae bacterium]